MKFEKLQDKRAIERLNRSLVFTLWRILKIMSQKINRDSENGQFVTKEFAEQNPATTVSETLNTKSEVEEFLKRLRDFGGAIVLSSECSNVEIAYAYVEGEIYVDEHGIGYIRRTQRWLDHQKSKNA